MIADLICTKESLMKKRKKIDSRAIGLEMGLHFLKYFCDTEHLHFGYWTPDLKIHRQNLTIAQENHSDFILQHIPAGVMKILDVGCGGGAFDLKLINAGYQVDCVSPSSFLAHQARKVLEEQSTIYECTYENLQTDKRYDIVLFSESFQYVRLADAIQKSLEVLNEGGYMLICDFFKTEAEGKHIMRSGHRLTKFYQAMLNYPFEQVKDIDITEQTAPTMVLANEFMQQVTLPLWTITDYYLMEKYPLLTRFLKWKYRKKLVKFQNKYFSGKIAENYKIFQSYRLLLYQK